MMNTILHILRCPFKRCRNTRGSSAVEVAITILPFFLSFFGVIEFGLYFFHQHTVQNATYEGIRVGLLGTQLLDNNNNVLSREASIVQAITDKAQKFVTLTAADITINPVGAAAGPANAGTQGQLMKVQVDYTHEFATSFIGGFFGSGNNIVIHAEGTYRNEDFI